MKTEGKKGFVKEERNNISLRQRNEEEETRLEKVDDFLPFFIDFLKSS